MVPYVHILYRIIEEGIHKYHPYNTIFRDIQYKPCFNLDLSQVQHFASDIFIAMRDSALHC